MPPFADQLEVGVELLGAADTDRLAGALQVATLPRPRVLVAVDVDEIVASELLPPRPVPSTNAFGAVAGGPALTRTTATENATPRAAKRRAFMKEPPELHVVRARSCLGLMYRVRGRKQVRCGARLEFHSPAAEPGRTLSGRRASP